MTENTSAPIRYREVMPATKLDAEWKALPLDFVRLHRLEYENKLKYGNKTPFVVVNADSTDHDILVVEINRPDLPFWVSPNAHDPDNPVSVAETIEKLMALAVPDPEDEGTLIVPDDQIGMVETSYYGSYASTLVEAVEMASRWLTTPISEWPKDYNRPIELER